MGTTRERKRTAPLVLLNACLATVVAALGAAAIAQSGNTLRAHPEWVVTKTALSRGVIGAYAYLNRDQALAGNRLNLAAWHGFHEVLYGEPVRAREIDARIRVEPDGYVHVRFDVAPGGSAGVRLSSNSRFPSISYRASSEGEFLEPEILDRADIAPDAWHRIRIELGGGSAHLLLNEEPIARLPISGDPARFGFRGGYRGAFVDDVRASLDDGSILVERFWNTTRFWQVFPGSAAAIVVLSILAVGFAGRLPVASTREAGLALATGLIALVAIAASLLALQYFRADRYERPGSANAQSDSYQTGASATRNVAELREKHSATPAADTYRILILGSSQTWGAGAMAVEDVWVDALERKLNASQLQDRIETINGGVSGLQARGTRRFYETYLSEFDVHAALINLGNNDTDTTSFRSNLEGLVEALRGRDIVTVLMLEANSVEYDTASSRTGDLAVKHDIVRKVAERYGLPVVDMHSYLAARADEGFLWWDHVHLTSFGQRLMAEGLATELPALLDLHIAEASEHSPVVR